MPLFNKDAHDDWRRKRSEEQLALGKLPLNAENRLRRLTENRRLFTSLMSVNEFVLIRQAGIVPCAQVTGTSVFHMGWQPQAMWSSGEVSPLSLAQTQARRLALVRMLREAQTLGAHGVIGVNLTENKHDWASNASEMTATGTAVRWLNARAADFPFACTLSGQDVLALAQAGYAPVGLALGICVYAQVASPMTTQVMQGGVFNSLARQNQEMTEYTHGLNEARRRATRCLEEDAACQHGDGIVDVRTAKDMRLQEVEVEMYERKVQRRDLLVTFSVIGTIIRAVHEAMPRIGGVLPLHT